MGGDVSIDAHLMQTCRGLNMGRPMLIDSKTKMHPHAESSNCLCIVKFCIPVTHNHIYEGM